MSFLFGKKSKEGKEGKGHVGPPQRPLDSQSAPGPGTSIPTINGARPKERAAGVISPPPGSSVNNSANSIDDTTTPSPEHIQVQRGRLDSDLSVCLRTTPNPPLAIFTIVMFVLPEDTYADGSLTQHAPRPTPTGPPPNINQAALYPWSQRRLTFTSSQPNPFPRYGAAVNASSSKEGDIYLMGGLINGSTVKGDLWMIQAGGSNFACYPVATTLEGPGPRVGHASLLVGNAFIVFGGDTKLDERDKLDDTLYLLNTCE